MMQVERRRDGESFILEAWSWDSQLLNALRKEFPRSYVQWERDGVPVRDDNGEIVSSGPAFALWRPAPVSAAKLAPAPPPELALDLELDLDLDLELDLELAPALSLAPTPEEFELDDPAEWLLEAPTPALPAPALAPEPQLHSANSVAAPDAAAAQAELAPPDTAILEAASEEAASEEAPQSAKRGPRGLRPPRELKSTRHKNVTRVDRPARSMHGFHVRMGWQGKVYQKWFSDEKHGDRLGALAAAIAWRDAQEVALGKPRSERTVIGRSSSSTGHVGVTKVTLGTNVYYRALWHDPDGRMRRRFFNIERLGEQRALKAAIRTREKGAALALR